MVDIEDPKLITAKARDPSSIKHWSFRLGARRKEPRISSYAVITLPDDSSTSPSRKPNIGGSYNNTS